MTEFKKGLRDFKKKTYLRTNAVVNGVIVEVDRSVRLGSELTNSPGQPVDTAYLLNSWQQVWQGKNSVTLITRTKYARPIEDGTREGRALTLRSEVGGFHSVKLTVAGYQRIVKHVVQTVRGTT